MPEPNSGCWLWFGAMVPDGYGSFYWDAKSGPYSIKAHRAAWILYCGEIPPDAQVLHRCDVRSCVNPDHLFLGDNDANVADRVAKGRSGNVFGEASPNAKITTELAVQVFKDSRSYAAIARQLNISEQTVRRIKRRLSWRRATEAVQ